MLNRERRQRGRSTRVCGRRGLQGILVDANLLLYAHFDGFAEHEIARTWLDNRLSGHGSLGMPWASLLGFVRVGTSRRILPRPQTVEGAWRQVEDWLDAPVTWIPQPTDHHRQILASLLKDPGITGNLIPDADLAALAIEHGLILCSADGDFARFPGLKWDNPLATARRSKG